MARCIARKSISWYNFYVLFWIWLIRRNRTGDASWCKIRRISFNVLKARWRPWSTLLATWLSNLHDDADKQTVDKRCFIYCQSLSEFAFKVDFQSLWIRLLNNAIPSSVAISLPLSRLVASGSRWRYWYFRLCWIRICSRYFDSLGSRRFMSTTTLAFLRSAASCWATLLTYINIYIINRIYVHEDPGRRESLCQSRSNCRPRPALLNTALNIWTASRLKDFHLTTCASRRTCR